MKRLTRSVLLRYDVMLIGVTIAFLFLWPSLLSNLFSTGFGQQMFMSHYECYLQLPQLWLLHFSTDLAIGMSYVAISVLLAYLVYRARGATSRLAGSSSPSASSSAPAAQRTSWKCGRCGRRLTGCPVTSS
ncbi:MAG: hypothetical protein M3371_02840 [Acidobacteriota bacterium]|nr:hypothetical protein [Acidobacteriota bacterium]